MHNNLPQVDELVIISGYLGPVPVQHLSSLPLNVKVFYGMYGENGISTGLHNSLLNAQSNYSNIRIAYTSSGVHSKCYIWKFRGQIVHALIGSANFSSNGLTTPNREVLTEVSPQAYNDLAIYETYVNTISDNCSNIILSAQQQTRLINNQNNQNNQNVCNMTLLDQYGNIPNASGINWGHGIGNVTPNDAYIAVRKDYIRNYPFLFPPKQISPILNAQGRQQRHNDIIEIIWDDGTVMEGLLEGNQDENGLTYPKQISTSPNKNILGIYLRNRLRVPQGAFVTYQDLENYGRFDISVSLQGAGVYNFDFSV